MTRDNEIETLPRDALAALQLRRLRATVKRVYAAVPFYRGRLEQAGVSPAHVRTLEDLRRLPFTTKDELRRNYPFGLLAVPMEDVVRIHASSGTTGQATVAGYTARDIRTWASLVARALAAAGVRRADVIHNAYGYGLLAGGLGVHYGAERLGAAVIPMSGGDTRRQIQIMRDLGATVLTCTPSYALHLAEAAQDMGVDFRSLKVRCGLFGGEPWSDEMRREIEHKLGVSAVDLYGLSEVMGPGVAVECQEAKKGLHVFEDCFIPEVVHPETLEPLPFGEEGELVLTTIAKEAFPLLRYRTRDVTSLNPEPCACGRTHVRMGRLKGRTDDIVVIRGASVFPSQIESLLMDVEGVEPYYQLVVEREGGLDALTVLVEVGESAFSDEIKKLQQLERRIEGKIKEALGLAARAKLVEPKTLSRSEGKAKRVIDNRKR